MGNPVVPTHSGPEKLEYSGWFLRLTAEGREFLDARPRRPPPPPASPWLGHPKVDDVLDLPAINPTWFVQGGRALLCDRFGSTRSPRCSKTCEYLHLQRPVGPCVDAKGLKFHQSNVFNDVLYKENQSKEGVSWFTSAYYDRDRNIYYKAEGGDGTRNQCDGVWYYATLEAARTSVARVHTIAQLHPKQIGALQRNEKHPTARSQPHPHPVRGHYAPFRPPPPPVRPGLS